MDTDELEISYHAEVRMRQMGVDLDTVRSVITDAECSWPSRLEKQRHAEDRMVYAKGDLSVVCTGNRVITILLRQDGKWDRSTYRASS